MYENKTGSGDGLSREGAATGERVAASGRGAARASAAGLVLAVVATVQFMVSLDITVVNVALPSIREGLEFSASSLAWVVNAYTLAFGGLLLLGGRLGDLVGRRRMLLGALGLFALASLAGGLAQTSGQLVAARAVQGVAAAGLAPASLALLSTTFPEGRARARALGIWAAVSAGGGAVGVLLSGVLTEWANWRWVLLINIPIAVGALIAGRRALAPDGPAPGRGRAGAGHALAAAGSAHGRGRPDVLGAVLVTAGVTALVLGVLRTDEHGWGSATTLATLALAVLLLGAFVLVEARVAQEPLVRLGLLSQRGLAAANVTMALICSGQFAAFYFVSLRIQEVIGYRPIDAGLAFLPFCAGLVFGAGLATRRLPRSGPRALVVPGALLAAVGLAWFALAPVDGGYLAGLLGPMLVTSTGLGLCFVPVTGAATAGVAPHEAGMASGLLNASRQVGGAVGLAVLVTVATSRESARLADGAAPLTALGDGQRLGLLVGAGLVALGAVSALALGEQRRGEVAGEPVAKSVAS